tara:strand:- start:505 stop:1431 length:927 start_codon:yes stop_codon:yes gene_type:complete
MHFDLKELLILSLKRKYYIFFITLAFAIYSVIYSLSLSNIYKSDSILVPAKHSENNLSSSMGTLGNLSAIAGINLNLDGSDKSNLAIQVSKSKEFFLALYQDDQFIAEMVAIKRYRPNENLKLDDEVFDLKTMSWLLDSSSITGTKKPSFLDAQIKFLDKFSIKKNIESGFIEASMQSESPIVAKAHLGKVINLLNETIKSMEVDDLNASINYLEDQISKSNLIEVKNILSRIMEQTIRSLMFSEISDEYALKIIDKPHLPELKIAPARSTLCITITLLGFIVSSLFFLIFDLNRERIRIFLTIIRNN